MLTADKKIRGKSEGQEEGNSDAYSIDGQKRGTIAFFCAEYGIDDRLPIYAGGLGILAGDFIIEASRNGTPFVALGLFYKLGFSTYPKQPSDDIEKDPTTAGFNLLRNEKGERVEVSLKIKDRIVCLKVWENNYEGSRVFLLDSDVETNSVEDRRITEHLYPENFDQRMVQQIVLGIGGVKLLAIIGIKPGVYHLNEGHTSFAALGLALDYMRLHNETVLLNAIKKVSPYVVGTKHTILAGAGIFFTKDQCEKYLAGFLSQYGVAFEEFFKLGVEDIDLQIFSTTRFLIRVSSLSNGVSKIHSVYEKETYPENKNMIAITNVVSQSRWSAKGLAGEAYTGDSEGVSVLEQMSVFIKEKRFNNIAYISDYNISVAKRLVRGADVWLNTPIKGKEASGTSGMKSALNGVIQCSVEDGWIEEVRDNAAIFVLDQHKTSADFYNILENKISSEYYERDGDNFPVLWAERMKSTRDIVLKSFLAERMFGEYMDLMYFPTTATKMKL